MTRLERAQRYHQLGLSVFPLDHPDQPIGKGDSIGKTPAIGWKEFQRTRATEPDLNLWFGNGHPHNIAIATGVLSGVVVVDTDTPEGEAWVATNLPPTPFCSRTAKGKHRIYRHSGQAVPNRVGVLPGVDIRGDGGYIVAPGSQHVRGITYEEVEPWPSSLDNAPIFDPTWLPADRGADPDTPPVPETISEGGRNDSLFREACRLRSQGWSESEILAALKALNLERCKPPLPDSEVATIAHSAARYEPKRTTQFPLTEVGDAEFFADRHGDVVRFDHRRQQWLLLSDFGIWLPDQTERLRAFVIDDRREQQHAAVDISDKDDKKRALSWHRTGEATKRINNALREARALPPIADDGSNWDLESLLIGAPNGVIDLETGALRVGRPEDRITMRVRPPYDPDAKCSLFERTIDQVFGGSVELIAYVQRAAGYSITGDCREEKFFVAHGEGGNGKGTVMNTIAYVLGDYADDLPFSALEMRDRSSIPADIAKLVGKRFVTASESGEASQLNEARIKALTGRDPITARYLHQNWFTFQPVAKFWLASNSKPTVRDDSEGFWRRVHLIPFTQSFVGRADVTLKDRLREEAPGILAWLVRGAMDWLREGLKPPKIVQAATDDYRRENEPLAEFLASEVVVVSEKASVRAGDLFNAYVSWCETSGVKPWDRLKQKKFGQGIRRQFQAEEAHGVKYHGIGLRAKHLPKGVEGHGDM